VAVVAARNEEETIAQTVKSLYHIEGLAEVVVVDDGSRDRTAQEASAAGVRVVVCARRRGKGGALERVLVRLTPADVYLFVDADTGDSACEAGALLAPVLGGEADVAVGRLPGSSGGGFGLVKGTCRWLIRAVGGLDLTEPMSGQRALSAEALAAMRPLAGGFGVETAMGIDAGRLGLRVVEVEVDMRHRPTGRGPRGFAHRARQGFDALVAALPRMLRLR
jgi:glycosyltransferase involved in cell wall biosynthesis